jgi:prephenate dehydrogenase
MSEPVAVDFHCETLAIVGVGLIGGSIARACRARGLADRIVGIGRTQSRLDLAVQTGVIDVGSTEMAALHNANLVVVCTPVDQVTEDVQRVLASSPQAVVTDAGSVKGSICRQLANVDHGERFVGSHPLAGSEKSGFEHADPELFAGRVCITTPFEETDPAVLQQVEGLWKSLGMQIRQMSPEKHDRLLALSSHLPHLAAAAIALQLSPEAADYASTGFRDTTRVASGDPALWTAILMENRMEVSRTTHDLVALLNEFQAALDSSNAESLQALLTQAQQTRELFLSKFLSREQAARRQT